jgi:hypothetical protein
MSNIDEQKIKEAKEKLACHIVPPSMRTAEHSSGSSSETAYVPKPGEKVRLTQMTTAGG